MNDNIPATRRWRRVLLPASLVVNLFLFALVGGHVLTHDLHARDSGGDVLVRALANAEASLSGADAAAFRAALSRDEPRYAQAARQLAEARNALEREIETEPFNQQAVAQTLAAWQMSWNRFFDAFDDTLIDALAHISPDGRRKLIAERRQAETDDPVP